MNSNQLLQKITYHGVTNIFVEHIITGFVFHFLQVANAMVANWAGPPAMLAIFRKLFGSFSCPHIVRQNNFTNLQHYFLQKASFISIVLGIAFYF